MPDHRRARAYSLAVASAFVATHAGDEGARSVLDRASVSCTRSQPSSDFALILKARTDPSRDEIFLSADLPFRKSAMPPFDGPFEALFQLDLRRPSSRTFEATAIGEQRAHL